MNSTKYLGVIPARYESTRLPGKPLAKISGKPMIQWVYEAAAKSHRLSHLVVATDHKDILEAVESFGGNAMMTSKSCPSGSDRVWEIAQNIDCAWVFNIQGDEPLFEPRWLDKTIDSIESAPKESEISMYSLATRLQVEEVEDPNAVKVILDQSDCAIYFSRCAIPYVRDANLSTRSTPALKHIGFYAYQKSFLQKYCSTPSPDIEILESLEQLRALHLGAQIKMLKVDEQSFGVDTPEDIVKIEAIMSHKKRV